MNLQEITGVSRKLQEITGVFSLQLKFTGDYRNTGGLGGLPFLEGSCGPPTGNFEKIKTRVQRHLCRVPKKPHMAKFKQTSDRGL